MTSPEYQTNTLNTERIYFTCIWNNAVSRNVTVPSVNNGKSCLLTYRGGKGAVFSTAFEGVGLEA